MGGGREAAQVRGSSRAVETTRHRQGGSAATGGDLQLLGVDEQDVVVGDAGAGVDRDRGLRGGDVGTQGGGDIDRCAAGMGGVT